MGDAAGLANESFEAYRRDVFAWAYRLLGNDHDADDVVQDVYLRWDQQCQVALPVHARGWLRRVTLNRAVDVHRRPGANSARLDSADHCDVRCDARRTSTTNLRQDLALDHAALRSDLATAMNELTDMQRSVLIAKVFDGLTFAGIATEHGLAVSTVKTHWLRAVRTLAAQLRDRWADEIRNPGGMSNLRPSSSRNVKMSHQRCV